MLNIIILGLIVGSFFMSIPVTAAQTELIFPLFKYSEEERAFWTILAIKENDFLAIVDSMELESSKQMVIYAFSTDVIGNVSIQVDVYDSYQIWTDDLGVERVNATQSLEPIIRESFNQKIHKIDLEVPETTEFKVLKISMGSSYFMLSYKTSWDYQTQLWTNKDLFEQVQLVNWGIILFVLLIALGIAIAFVSRAKSIPPFTKNPLPQFMVVLFGLSQVSSGITIRPPNMLALTVGMFCVVMMICMQLWSSLKTDIKKALILDTRIDKPLEIQLVMFGGDAYYINEKSWRDTFFRLAGVNYPITNFHLYKRTTAEGSTQDFLLYGNFTKPKPKFGWKGLRPYITVEPCKLDAWDKAAVGLVRDSLVELYTPQKTRLQLKAISEALDKSVKKFAERLQKTPLLFKFPFWRRVLQKIPLIRRLTVFITPNQYVALQILRKELIEDITTTEFKLDELLTEYRKLQEEPYELHEEQSALVDAGHRIKVITKDRNRLQRQVHTLIKVYLGEELVAWEMAERGLEVETDLPQKQVEAFTHETSEAIDQEADEE